MHNLGAASCQKVHRHVFDAGYVPDTPGNRVFTVAWDASYLLLGHIVQDFIFEGPGLALSHCDRVEHSVLTQEESDGSVMLVKAHHYLAQFGLLLIQELSVRVHIWEVPGLPSKSSVRCDIQDRPDNKQDPEGKPKATTEIAKRPPIEHDRS
jgi:hypothetical protein